MAKAFLICAACLAILYFEPQFRSWAFFALSALLLIGFTWTEMILAYRIEKECLLVRQWNLRWRAYPFSDLRMTLDFGSAAMALFFDDEVIVKMNTTSRSQVLRQQIETVARSLLPHHGYQPVMGTEIDPTNALGCASCLNVLKVADITDWRGKTPFLGLRLGRSDCRIPICPVCGSDTLFVATDTANDISTEGLKSLQKIFEDVERVKAV